MAVQQHRTNRALSSTSSPREYFVEMYYRNETWHEPHPLTLPGCTPSCPLKKFAELVAPVIPQDWSAECATSSHEGTKDVMHQGTWVALQKGRTPFLRAVVALRVLLGLTPIFERNRFEVIMVCFRDPNFRQLLPFHLALPLLATNVNLYQHRRQSSSRKHLLGIKES